MRLPVVLLSPYIDPGTVVHTIFDQTSIIKTVCSRWNLPPLTERDKAANDLSEALTLDSPRDDEPMITPRIFQRTPRPEDEPLNDFQKGLLATVTGITAFNRADESKNLLEKVAQFGHLVQDEYQVRRLKKIGQAWKFMKERLDFAFQYEVVDEEKSED